MKTIDFSIEDQRNFFKTGVTLRYDFRRAQLKKMKQMIQNNENEFIKALAKDFNKPPFETYVSEIQTVYDELDYMLKHLKKFMKPKKTKTPLMHFYSKSKVVPEPLGSVLIISPWNYPINLTLIPLIGAMTAGNCAVVKPSEISSNTSKLLHDLIQDYFHPRYIQVIEGEAETTQQLIEEGFDYCFFTGSSAVGKKIMKSASEHLTPVTLELGGKSPCIVAEDADIVKAACRIVWGKFLNAGQTCIAPDYILVHESLKNKFISMIQEVLYRFYGQEVLENPDYPSIINEKHFERLQNLIDEDTLVYGGEVDEDYRKISPTLLDEPALTSEVMDEEIFGPILPILSFDSMDEAIATIESKPKPLALYLFTQSKQTKEFVMDTVSFGGGSINDTVIHVSNPHIPFGGVGESGMGHYHGKYSFETFSNLKGIVEKTTLFDLPMRYAPYKDSTLTLIKKFL